MRATRLLNCSYYLQQILIDMIGLNMHFLNILATTPTGQHQQRMRTSRLPTKDIHIQTITDHHRLIRSTAQQPHRLLQQHRLWFSNHLWGNTAASLYRRRQRTTTRQKTPLHRQQRIAVDRDEESPRTYCTYRTVQLCIGEATIEAYQDRISL